MGLTTSLYTALTGLNSSSASISITGNNIANANTTGFKASRADFDTQILQSLGDGTAPTGNNGGTNPIQVGLGTKLSGTTRNMTNGTLSLTGVNTDMAIEGTGFFVLNNNGSQRYTRAGAFTLDINNHLVTGGGAKVQGYGIDSNFNVVEGTLADLTIPVGTLTLAEATTNVKFSGNLNGAGTTATTGSITTSDTLFSDVAGTTPITAATSLTSVYDAAGQNLFSTGDVITITRVAKGGAIIPDKNFEVGANTTNADAAGTTMQDYLTFMNDIFGIDTAVGGGATINNGQLRIESNSGTVNGIEMKADNVIVNQKTSAVLPFTFNTATQATGESVRTSFVIYDSLGSEMTVDLNVVLEQKNNTGTTWRFYAQSEDDSDLNRVMGNGTVSFDTSGRFLSSDNTAVTIDRAGTGALSPQQFKIAFNEPVDSTSALANSISQLAATQKDGNAIGTLGNFNVSTDGTVVGVFSNGLTRELGKVVLARFSNQDGLSEVSGNMFEATAASGDAALVVPGNGAGNVIGQALELSNVDLSQEFISLINATTGFSANSRVFTTSDRLIQELLSSLR